jgi:hypothetical protein
MAKKKTHSDVDKLMSRYNRLTWMIEIERQADSLIKRRIAHPIPQKADFVADVAKEVLLLTETIDSEVLGLVKDMNSIMEKVK